MSRRRWTVARWRSPSATGSCSSSLAATPGGLTGDQLALALYGPEGKPVTARAEVSRLRRAVGPALRTDPYRLDADVRADFAAVQRMAG